MFASAALLVFGYMPLCVTGTVSATATPVASATARPTAATSATPSTSPSPGELQISVWYKDHVNHYGFIGYDPADITKRVFLDCGNDQLVDYNEHDSIKVAPSSSNQCTAIATDPDKIKHVLAIIFLPMFVGASNTNQKAISRTTPGTAVLLHNNSAKVVVGAGVMKRGTTNEQSVTLPVVRISAGDAQDIAVPDLGGCAADFVVAYEDGSRAVRQSVDLCKAASVSVPAP